MNTKDKKRCNNLTFLLITFFIVACSGPTVTAEQRLESLSTIDNFTFKYHTVVHYETETPRRSLVYDGEGRITKNGLSTNESYYAYFEYPLNQLKDEAVNYNYSSVEKYIEDYYLREGATYKVDEANQNVTMTNLIRFYNQYFISVDEENKQIISVYRIYVTGEVELLKEEEELKPSILTYKDYISTNKSLFEEVIQEKNKSGKNSYYIEKPTSQFYYANSGLLLTAHIMDSIRITFNGTTIQKLDYVFEGRDISTTISNVGSTALIEKPKVA